MKVLIFNSMPVQFDETSLNYALGGSETWAIQLSDAFRGLGHGVVVVCNCRSHVAANGVRYVGFDDIGSISSEWFDFAIASRAVTPLLRVLSAYGLTDSVFLQLHDPQMIDFTLEVSGDPRVRKIVCLTEWHAETMSSLLGVNRDRIEIIPNGVDPLFFEDVDPVSKIPDHGVLWSSCFERGLRILAEDIAPIVRKDIPDFYVEAASYSDTQAQFQGLDVRYLGRLGKKDLYSRMKKHAVWFFPSINDETFCITAIENMACGNNIVMHPAYGTTEYSKLIDPIITGFSDRAEYAESCGKAAEMIVRYIRGFSDASAADLRVKARNFVLGNFTWRRSAEKYVDLASRVRG